MTLETTVSMPPTSTRTVEKSSLMEYEALANDDYDTAELDVDVSSHEIIPPPPSLAHIYKLCIANFGISGAWALEFAVTTPYFESRLRSGQFLSHIVWIVGPLSGLIVAPIVGMWSDKCTSKYGRRRPFILAGIISTMIGMILFPLAPNIAALFAEDGSEAHRIAGIVIAFVSFCILDLAINTTMWPGTLSLIYKESLRQPDTLTHLELCSTPTKKKKNSSRTAGRCITQNATTTLTIRGGGNGIIW